MLNLSDTNRFTTTQVKIGSTDTTNPSDFNGRTKHEVPVLFFHLFIGLERLTEEIFHYSLIFLLVV